MARSTTSASCSASRSNRATCHQIYRRVGPHPHATFGRPHSRYALGGPVLEPAALGAASANGHALRRPALSAFRQPFVARAAPVGPWTGRGSFLRGPPPRTTLRQGKINGTVSTRWGADVYHRQVASASHVPERRRRRRRSAVPRFDGAGHGRARQGPQGPDASGLHVRAERHRHEELEHRQRGRARRASSRASSSRSRTFAAT